MPYIKEGLKIIDGIEVRYLSEWDDLPIKNRLPEELKNRMKTKLQWMEIGYVLKEHAVVYEMHPNVMAKRLCEYYLDKDVEPINNENAPKNCLTCRSDLKSGRYCEILGDFISSQYSCSEWEL